MARKNGECLNCSYQLSPDDNYCPQCGLETVYRNLSIGFLIKSFFEAFLNFDMKMFNSSRDLWIPNKITKTFLEGKREYHVHPFRFYFICLVVFFTLLSINTKNMDVDMGAFDLQEKASKYELYQRCDSISNAYLSECEEGTLDSIKLKIYEGTSDLDKDTFFNVHIAGSNLSNYGISSYDGITMKPEDIFEKYNVERKLDRYAITQIQRIALDRTNAARFVIGNMIWGLILLTIIMAFVLKLLYIRHDSYYIEHLLHISNYHCVSLILISIVLLIKILFPSLNLQTEAGIAAILGILYLWISLKMYYAENIFKTILKMIILGSFYWIVTFMIALLIGLLSLAVY